MHYDNLINQEVLVHQIASQAGIINKQQQDLLKKSFDKKYAHHVNRIQYHRLREDRFARSQKKMLDYQQKSIQQAKEHLALKLNKANYIKNHSMLERSKRIEEDLNKWEKRVEKNKKQQQQRVEESLKLIQEWNDKISDSSTNRELKLSSIGKHLTRSKAHKSIDHSQINTEREPEPNTVRQINPEEKQQQIVTERYHRQLKKKGSRKNLRVSTQSMHDRKQKQEESIFEDAVIKTGEKQERINEARFIKHYMLERKKKMTIEKEENRRKLQKQHLSQIRMDLEARNRELDSKLKSDKIRVSKKRSSLPLISGSKATKILLNQGPGQQWRSRNKSKEIASHIDEETLKNGPNCAASLRAIKPSYDKLVRQKLRDIALLTRQVGDI